MHLDRPNSQLTPFLSKYGPEKLFYNLTVDGNVTATKFIGPLQGNADTATKATQDSDGNAINTTYLKLSGGTMTGDVNFYTSGSGVTPGIVFQRGPLTDNYNDWKIWDEGGYLYFGQRGSNSTSFDKNIYMDNSGSLHANLTGNASTATKATQDESGNNIKATYGASIGISGRTVTLSNKNGTSISTADIPIATGSALGVVKIGSGISVDSNGVISVSASGLGIPEAMLFKGSLGTGGTITSLPAAASTNKGFVYKVITAGTY
jgi:hypothetical protein